MGLLLPTLFIVFIVFSFQYIKRAIFKWKLPKENTLFLLAFFIPTFVGFALITPIYWVKLNWMMPSYITGIIIAGMMLKRKTMKIHLIISIVLHLAIATQILFYLVPIKSDDTWVSWQELSEATIQLKKEYPNAFLFSADGYKTSAVLNFYLEEKVYSGNILGLHGLHFEYLGDDLTKLNGLNALYIDSDKRFKTNDKRGEILPLELKEYLEKKREFREIFG